MEQLKSKSEEDLEINANILSEIMRSFSLTFGVTNEEIVNIIAREQGDINVEDIRKKLLAHGQ